MFISVVPLFPFVDLDLVEIVVMSLVAFTTETCGRLTFNFATIQRKCNVPGVQYFKTRCSDSLLKPFPKYLKL